MDEAIAYRTVPETDDDTQPERRAALERLKNEGADMVTFASSSAAENFLALKVPLPEGARVASLGPVTSQTLRAAGLRVDVESPSAGLDAFRAGNSWGHLFQRKTAQKIASRGQKSGGRGLKVAIQGFHHAGGAS